MRHRPGRSIVTAVAISLMAVACAPGAVPHDGPVVSVFGGYRGVEAQRFAASIAPFENETGIDVHYVGTGSFAKAMEERVLDADYPDIASTLVAA